MSKLAKVAIACGLIGLAGIGAGIIGYVKGYRDTSSQYQDETIFERRARFLNIANAQMLQTQNPETINGLNSVIKDIENGVYDHTN